MFAELQKKLMIEVICGVSTKMLAELNERPNAVGDVFVKMVSITTESPRHHFIKFNSNFRNHFSNPMETTLMVTNRC
jgi:hypothetical protein